jgi:hypothetical protein
MVRGGIFQGIDLSSDLRDLPRIAFRTPAIWLPSVILLATFAWFDARSTVGDASVPALAFNLLIYPPPVAITFLAGLLTHRSSYLAGGIVGLIAGALFSVYVMTVPLTPPAGGSLSVSNIRTENLYYALIGGLMVGVTSGAFGGLIASFIRKSRR